MKIANDEILPAPVDLSGSFSSNAILIAHASYYAIQLLFTGTPQGTFKLQASNDIGQAQRGTEVDRGNLITNWTDITGSPQAITEAGNHMWAVECAPYRWVRVVWTPTGGSGSLTSLRANTKGS